MWIPVCENQLTLFPAVMPGITPGGVILCCIHERLFGWSRGQAIFLPDLVDKCKDLFSDLQIICVIGSGSEIRPVSDSTGYRDREIALLPVCRNSENPCGTGRFCNRDPIPGNLLYRKDIRIT